MNIGVDVDGVLADLNRFLKEKGVPYFKRKFGLSVADPEQSHAEQMFGCTPGQRKRFWWDCGYYYLTAQPSIAGSSDVLSDLSEDGNSIIIITSRALTANRGPFPALLRHLLRSWLRKNGIAYDKLVFCSEHATAEDKRQACLENGIDVMIDDTIENLLAVKDVVRDMARRIDGV